MSKKGNSLWVEKYRPQTIKDFIGNEHIVEKFGEFIDAGEVSNILFHGHAGSGKTTMAKILINSIDCDYLFINASDENNVETVREKLKTFATSAGFKGKKVVVLDEADNFSVQAQQILRALIEAVSKHCRFILTCNYPEKLIDPLKSRFEEYHVTPPNKKDVAKRLVKILKSEEVEFEPKDLKKIINLNFPDIRRCIKVAQQNTMKGKLKLNNSTLTKNDYTEEIVKLLRTKMTMGSFYTKVRQCLADSGVTTFEDIYKELYKNLENISSVKYPYMVQIIAQSQFQYSFVVDKEIEVMSMLVKLNQELYKS